MGQRKKFDKAFKEQVVLRILAGETTFVDAAKELDVHYTTVRDWVKFYKQDGDSAFPGSGNLKAEDDEIRKLRKQLVDLKEENDILKKAAAYFAKNQK
ncbi:transposase [Paenibacillus sp. 1_12]|uniref:transposase n=1 Tax=Paenibacillus sp. 1_12 TaxID=1566278 RepID=UPI0008E93751|nr:transposase [Paenibacillus sp. 1_12]SFM55370.1 transposase [Paenibacillus sp. 1_12]